MPDPTILQQAEQAIADFEQSNTPGVWLSLDKTQVVADVRSRINDPFQVNQGAQPFCGPAAILFELVRKQPLRYVQICRTLFEMGAFQGYTKWITASQRLRESGGRLHMGQADWMVLSTMRESENLIFAVEPDAPIMMRNLAGMTKSWEMKGWTREILGYRQTKYTHTYIYGEFRAMEKAKSVIESGGVAFALITAEGLLQNKKPLLPYPSHWISLLGNISMQRGNPWQNNSGHVSFDIYTWARQMHLEVDEGPFEDYFWGIVMGRMPMI